METCLGPALSNMEILISVRAVTIGGKDMLLGKQRRSSRCSFCSYRTG